LIDFLNLSVMSGSIIQRIFFVAESL